MTRHQRVCRIQRLFYWWQSFHKRRPYQSYGIVYGHLLPAHEEFYKIYGTRLRAYMPKEESQ